MKMASIDLKNHAFLILVAILTLCGDFGACYARESKSWRQSRVHLSGVMDKGHKKYITPPAAAPKPMPPAPMPVPAPAPKPKPKPPAPMPVPAPAPKPKPKPPAPAPTPIPAPPAPARAPSPNNPTTFNVQDYGAKGDGHTDDRKVILRNHLLSI